MPVAQKMDDDFDPIDAMLPPAVVSDLIRGLAAEARALRPERRKLGRIDPFNLPLNEDEWRQTFRFSREDIGRVCDALRLPAIIRTSPRGVSAPREHALIWLLFRYVGGQSYLKCQLLFGPHRSTISRIVTYLEHYISNHVRAAFQRFHPLISRASLDRYQVKLAASGCPIPNVWAFIDGVKWEVCRPGGTGLLQRTLYSGYIKGHSISYHVIVSPDGMIQQVGGPFAGHGNDLNVLEDSKVEELMEMRPGMTLTCDRGARVRLNVWMCLFGCRRVSR